MTFTPSPPLKITRLPGGFRIEDATGRSLLTISCRQDADVARAANLLTFEEGEDLAKRVARALDGK